MKKRAQEKTIYLLPAFGLCLITWEEGAYSHWLGLNSGLVSFSNSYLFTLQQRQSWRRQGLCPNAPGALAVPTGPLTNNAALNCLTCLLLWGYKDAPQLGIDREWSCLVSGSMRAQLKQNPQIHFPRWQHPSTHPSAQWVPGLRCLALRSPFRHNRPERLWKR